MLPIASRALRFTTLGATLSVALLLGACATSPEQAEDRARDLELERLAASVLSSGGGHVGVRLRDGVCFVYGSVESKTDEAAILNVLRQQDDVVEIRNVLSREM